MPDLPWEDWKTPLASWEKTGDSLAIVAHPGGFALFLSGCIFEINAYMDICLKKMTRLFSRRVIYH
jgi:hypothetical protein